MSMSKLPIFLVGILGVFMPHVGIAAVHKVQPVLQVKPKIAMPCLIGNVALAEKLVDLNYTQGPFVPYRFLGIPVLAGATVQINIKPDMVGVKNTTTAESNWIKQVNQFDQTTLPNRVSPNLLFDAAMLFQPWMVGYLSMMGKNLAVHNYALIFGQAGIPVNMTVGRFHIPFGLNATEDLDGGLTGKLGTGENTTAMTVSGMSTLFNHHQVKVKSFVFSPKKLNAVTSEITPYDDYHFGTNVHYEGKQGDINWALGGSYATQLVKSNSTIEGVDGYVNVGIGPVKVKAEGVQGRDLLKESKGKENSSNIPYAWTIEGSYHLPIMNRDTAVVGGYSRGDNGEILKDATRIYIALKRVVSSRVKMVLAFQRNTTGVEKLTTKERDSVNLQFAFTI